MRVRGLMFLHLNFVLHAGCCFDVSAVGADSSNNDATCSCFFFLEITSNTRCMTFSPASSTSSISCLRPCFRCFRFCRLSFVVSRSPSPKMLLPDHLIRVIPETTPLSQKIKSRERLRVSKARADCKQSSWPLGMNPRSPPARFTRLRTNRTLRGMLITS